jgi:hypothetical protein
MGKIGLLFFLSGALALSALGCRDRDVGTTLKVNRSVPEKNKLLEYFAGQHPGNPIVKYALGDIDNNGRADLIVIYRVGAGKNMMRALLDKGDSYEFTNEVPAPVSDQVIEFKDIDEKPPLEFIVQGRKGAKIGFAIFRLVNGRLVDLFGEGMADCC